MFKLCIFAAILATALAAPAAKPKPSILGYDGLAAAPYVSAPVVAPAPVVSYASAAPVSSYVAPISTYSAPVSSYVAPVSQYVAPAVSSSFAYSPVSSYVAPVNSYVAPLSYNRYIAPSFNAYHSSIF